MTDPGYNEVVIRVTTEDTGAAIRSKIKADNESLGKTEVQVPVTLSDPVTDAWRAKVNAEIKAAAKQSLDIPVNADTEALRTEVAEALADAKAMARLEVPAELADAETFRASVEGLVASVRAEIAGGIQVPITIDTSGARTAAADVADLTPGVPESSSGGSLRPSYSPQPLFSGGQDPYAAAREKLADEPPVELPVVAENPITQSWMAQVTSQIRSLTAQAVKIPVTPDTAAFREQVSSQLAELADLRESIPVDANTDAFRMEVTEQVEQISATVRAVITVDADDASLADMRAKILAAADASAQEAKAQQDLADAMAKGDPAEIAKAQEALAVASKDAGAAAEEQAAAMGAAAEAELAAGAGADAAAVSMRSLNAAMGPLWAVMNVAQIAMFALYSTGNQTSAMTQDLSQQLIQLGASGASAASSLSGNSGLAGINTQLETIGSSSAAFSRAFSGSLQEAKGYVNQLTTAQQQLGNQSAQVSQELVSGTSGGKAAGESLTATYKTTTQTIAQLTQQVNDHKISEAQLPQAVQDNINKYNAYNDVIGQAKKALADEQATQLVVTQDLAQQGIVLSQAQQGWNSIGQGVANTVSEFNSATSGVKSMSDALVAADQANIQATTNFAHLSAAVASTEQAYQQAVHGIATAEQGAAAAEQTYQNALLTEANAQKAVGAARQQAQQDLINLQLSANDAAASSLSAGTNLFDAQQAAAAFGINGGNAQAVASQTVTAQNEAAVKAAIALIQAENQVADAQNSSSQAQNQLTTAQKAGIEGSSAVTAANQALAQSIQQVTAAQIAAQNADYGVSQARMGAKQAADAHTAAVEANKRTTDLSTAAGNANWQMLENLFEKNFAATGSVQAATLATEDEGEKMGFTAGQIDGVINAVTRIPANTQFSIVGTPSLNLSALISQASSEGIDPYTLGLSAQSVDLARGPIGGSYADGGPIGGSGGPTADDQLIWASTGEHMWTADEVQAAGGHSAVEALRRAVKGYANGGAVTGQQAMHVNYQLGAWDAFLQATSYGLQSLGASTPNLPRGNGDVDLGGFGASAGSGGNSQVSGNRAANKAIMQQVYATFGWGSGAQWAAQDYVEMREAGYNNLAQNPTSTAFGMPQFLNSTWAGYGIPKTTDPTLQSIAMARYEAARYGDPIGAAAHERAYNWYANGGPTSGSVVGMSEHGAELARLPNGSTVLPHANSSTLLGKAQALQVEITMHVESTSDSGLVSWFKQQVRTGQIRFTTSNGQVSVA